MQIAIQLISGKYPEKYYDPTCNNICRLLDNRWSANNEAQMYKVAIVAKKSKTFQSLGRDSRRHIPPENRLYVQDRP